MGKNDAEKIIMFAVCALGLFCFFVSIFSGAYFLFRLTPLFVWLTITVVTIVFLCRYSRTAFAHKKQWTLTLHTPQLTQVAYFIAILLVIALPWFFRSSEALQSPWQLLPWVIFPMYAVSFFLLLWNLFRVQSSATTQLLMLSFFYFATYSVLIGTYFHGFGFDPFIHRTAEDYLAMHHELLPKHPYYTGQYVIVAALHWLTSLSVDVIDIWLLPTLTAVFLPAIGVHGLIHGWGRERNHALLAMAILPFFACAFFTFTVPNNVAMFFLFCVVLLLPLCGRDRFSNLLFILLVIATFLCHPIPGAIALGIFLSCFLFQKIRASYAALLTFFFHIITIPFLLVLRNWLHGDTLVSVSNPLLNIRQFFGLFGSPYVHRLFVGPWYLSVLYGVSLLMPLIVCVIAILGLRKIQEGEEARQYPAFSLALAVAGLFFAVFLMSTSITIPGIIAHEQFEFSFRIIQSWILLLFPFLTLLIVPRILETRKQLLAFLILSLLIPCGWYFTYPQRNAIAQYAGQGVSSADFRVAEYIRDDAGSEKYIVLSNQMLSVAALRTLGFADFPYALPTGGELYPYFLEMLFHSPSRETMESTMIFTSSQKSYFVLHDYDPATPELHEHLQSIADRTTQIDTISIYTFHRAN